MALSFTEGSIGGDIERIDLGELGRFYGGTAKPTRRRPGDGTARIQRHRHRAAQHGERQRAAADQPAHQLLLPLRAADDQRRGAERLRRADLGAVLHLPGVQREGRVDAHLLRASTRSTSSPRRVTAGRQAYRYGSGRRPLEARSGDARSASPTARSATRSFTTWRTHHGPIVAERDGNVDRVRADEASRWRRWSRAGSYQGDRPRPSRSPSGNANSNDTTSPTREARSPISTRNSCPSRRAVRLHPTVDGSDPATDWQRPAPPRRAAQAMRPLTGWVMNTNNSPWTRGGRGQSRRGEISRATWTRGRESARFRRYHAAEGITATGRPSG